MSYGPDNSPIAAHLSAAEVDNLIEVLSRCSGFIEAAGVIGGRSSGADRHHLATSIEVVLIKIKARRDLLAAQG